MRHNGTAEQIDSYSSHHGPDEPLDQTIWIAGGHTPRILLSHTAKSRANRHIERQPPPGASTIRRKAPQDRDDIRTECAGVIAYALSRVLPGEVRT